MTGEDLDTQAGGLEDGPQAAAVRRQAPILEVAAFVEVADVDGAGKPCLGYRRWLYQDISVFGT